MSELYKLAFHLCVQALIPNPYTVDNLPDHQRMYIIQRVVEVCKKETQFEKLMMCIEQNKVDCEVM